MKIENMTFAEMKALVSKPHSPSDDVMVRMHSLDLDDHYLIIEDRRESDKNGHADSYFLFYFADADSGDLAFEVKKYPTMIEAMLYYSYRFVLDNCDGADTSDPGVSARHGELQNALRNMIE